MKFDLATFTGSDRIVVGAFKVNKPFKHENRSYECAAWRETTETCVGVYPVVLGRSSHYPKHLTLTAEIKSVVIDDYFPSLWGGVSISNEPYKPKHLGENRMLRHGLDIVQSIERTGNIPDGDCNVFINPHWWSVFLQEVEIELKETHLRLPEFWDAYVGLDKENFKPNRNGLSWSFCDEVRSKIRMVAHIGMNMELWARRIDKIIQAMQRINDPSEYMKGLFKKNTEWSKELSENW